MGGDVFRDEYSLEFDGTNDYVNLGNQTNSGDDISVAAWVKLSVSQVAPIITFGQLYFRLNSSTEIRFWADSTGNSTITTIPNCLNKWIHLAVSSDAGVNKVYANGVLLETETDTTLGNSAAASYIGRYSTAYFEGKISDVTIYNKVLSTSEVKTIYNDGEPYNHKDGICSGNLTNWWRMGDRALDSYPLIQSQENAIIGISNLISNDTFDANTTGWEQYSEGTDNVISRETSIVRTGSGSLKITYKTGNNGWGAKTESDVTYPANKFMLMEGYVYIPSSGYNGGAPYLHDGGGLGSGAAHEKQLPPSDVTITDQWQYTYSGHHLSSDTSSSIFLHTTGTNPSADDILYWDDIRVRIFDGNPGLMINMGANQFKGDTP